MTVLSEEIEFWEAVDPADPDAYWKYICSEPPTCGLGALTRGLRLPMTGQVLDFGCGPGRMTLELAMVHPALKFHGYDISEPSIKFARKRAKELQVSNANFFEPGREDRGISPSPDDTYVAVYSMMVFQHLPSEAVATYLSEFSRILKPGGRFCFQYVEGSITGPFHHDHSEESIRWFCGDAGLEIEDLLPDSGHPEWRWVWGSK